MPHLPKMIDGLRVSNDPHLDEKAARKKVLDHWKQHRPKYYQYLREHDVLIDAVKMAIEARENLWQTLVLKGVYPRTAAYQARRYHTLLPGEDRVEFLEPDQAPLGQPGLDDEEEDY